MRTGEYTDNNNKAEHRTEAIDSSIKLAADDDDIRSFNVLITWTGNGTRRTHAQL